ncbi:MAG TPA: divergent polysaccharide deacetylase family protein, partial [Desulfurivibrionaceae bacterium]|nr:divergent polysaccharide deacetylase family protein [Desulfurivibrionaceae bacterium]
KKKPHHPRRFGRLFLLFLVLASLAGIGYFVFLQVPLFPPAPELPPQAQAPAEEPLATPPPAPAVPQEAPVAQEESPPSPIAAPTPPPAAPAPTTPPTPAATATAPPLPATKPAAVEGAPPQPAKKPVAAPTQPAKAGKKPMVAIIIDDMGYQPAIGRKMLNLPLNLSFSFLPAGPQAKELAAAAQGKKRDILLHLPLEATDRKADAGPGTLTVAMDDQELRKKFAENLSIVPMAIGVNNHMGSRFTEDRPAMSTLLGEVKQRGLFFLDSRTSTKSLACTVAKENGVPCLPRHLFLDNEQTQAAITKQIDALLAQAEKNGWAIGIGHPHPATLAALMAHQQALTERAEVVGIGTLFRSHGR